MTDAAALTALDAKAGRPLLEGDLLVLVSVTLLEEAGGAVLHGHQGDPEQGQLRVGQHSAQSKPLSHFHLCSQTFMI